MQIEIEEPEQRRSLERSLELVVQGLTRLSQEIVEGNTGNTKKEAEGLKQRLRDLENGVAGLGDDAQEEAELDRLIQHYEKENAEMNEKVARLEERSQKAEALLKDVLDNA